MLLVTVGFALPSLIFCFNPFFSTDGISRGHPEITQTAILRKTAEVCRDIANSEGRDFSLIIDDSLSVAEVQAACTVAVNETCPISSYRFQIGIENIVLSNGLVDLTMANEKAYHFHDETFQEGRNIITAGLASVKENVNMNRIVIARQRLGQILHVLQDFYSHSNWVELGNETPFSTLIKPDEPLENLAGPDTPTCRNQTGQNEDNILPEVLQQQMLTSGYFSETSPEKPAGKCSHGGPSDLTSARDPTGGISKDDINSSHGSLHQKAANLAVNATVELLEDIRQAVGDQRFLKFMGLPQVAVLCFVIDTTATMGDDIEEARRVSFEIIDRRRGTSEEPGDYLLVLFNDPDPGDVLYTNDSEIFRERFNSLTADGGGDVAEPSLSPLLRALSEAPPSSEIFLFTDAEAKDANLKGSVSALITSTKSKVTIISTDSDVVSLSASQAQIYSDLAIASGSCFIQCSKDELSNAVPVIQDLTHSSSVTVLHTQSNSEPLNFTLDASLMDICIFIIGASSFNLISPTGVSQDSSQSSGPLGSLTVAGNLFRLPLNDGNLTGTWQLIVERQSSNVFPCVKVSGRSLVDVSFSLLNNEEGHYFLADRRPAPGHISLLVTVTGDDITVISFTMFDVLESTVITGSVQPLPLDSSRFLVIFTEVPSGTFVVAVTGESSSSLGMFQRQCSTHIRTANVSVATNFTGNTIETDSATTISITVFSITAGVFTLRVTNGTINFIIIVLWTVTIPENGSVIIDLNIRAATTLEPVTLVLEVENAEATDSNFAVLRLSVSERETDSATDTIADSATDTIAIITTTSPAATTTTTTTTNCVTTTVNPTTSKPVTTAVNPTTTNPETTTVNPTTSNPETTAVNPTTSNPVTTAVNPTTTNCVTTVVNPTTTNPETTTVNPTTSKPVTTAVNPTTTNPETTTVNPTTSNPETTAVNPTTSNPVTTAVNPTTTNCVTTVVNPTTTNPETTTVNPTTSKPVTTAVNPTTTNPETTTVNPTTSNPVTTAVNPTTTNPETTTVNPTTSKPVTTAVNPTTTYPETTTVNPTTSNPVTTVVSPTTTNPETTTVDITDADPVITTATITTGSVNLLTSTTSKTTIVNKTTTNPIIRNALPKTANPMKITVLTINTTLITTVVNTTTTINPITTNALTCNTNPTSIITVWTTTTTFATTTINTTTIIHTNTAIDTTNNVTTNNTVNARSTTNTIIIYVPETIVVCSTASPVTITALTTTGMIVMMALILSLVN
ncbi:uncharacterized protein V6R79_010449 [Siganus canaliculatus]